MSFLTPALIVSISGELELQVKLYCLLMSIYPLASVVNYKSFAYLFSNFFHFYCFSHT